MGRLMGRGRRRRRRSRGLKGGGGGWGGMGFPIRPLLSSDAWMGGSKSDNQAVYISCFH